MRIRARTSIISSILATTRSSFHHTCSFSSSSSSKVNNISRVLGSTSSTSVSSSSSTDWNPQRITDLYSLTDEALGLTIKLKWVNRKRGNRWLVMLSTDGVEFLTEQQLFDHYVDVLASVVPSKEEARNKIYLVSCERFFGFGAQIDANSANGLNGIGHVKFLVEDHYYGARNEDPNVQSVAQFTGINWNHRLNDIYSYYHLSNFNSEWNHDHWIVHVKNTDREFANALDIFRYCVKLLAKVVGSRKDAKNKVYAVWWKIPFGFCAAIDEDSSNKLKALQDVLAVLPDYSLDIKRKCKFGDVLFVEPPWGEVQPFSRLSYSSYGFICEPDDPVKPLRTPSKKKTKPLRTPSKKKKKPLSEIDDPVKPLRTPRKKKL